MRSPFARFDGVRWVGPMLLWSAVCVSTAILVHELGASRVYGQGDLPPCNGQTTTNAQECGEERDCEANYPTCSGNGVDSTGFTNDCKDGSSNELCDTESIECTGTFDCQKNDAFMACYTNSDDPVLDSEGNPVVSTEETNTLQSCAN